MRWAAGIDQGSMSQLQKVSGALLALLLLAAGVVWFKTAPPSAHTMKQRAAQIAAKELVDQTGYSAAEQLARWAATPDEQTLSQNSLRIADHELDLAFTGNSSENFASIDACSSLTSGGNCTWNGAALIVVATWKQSVSAYFSIPVSCDLPVRAAGSTVMPR